MQMIVVHGGTDRPCREEYLSSLRAAALYGYGHLATGILDAVEKAVNHLEDDPLFNCGFGAELNRDGEAEMDAAIVDGASGRWGVVAAIQKVQHPVSVARLVMEKTPHVLLVGSGATRFARQQGWDEFDSVAPARRRDWEQAITGGKVPERKGGDTVGCLAVAEGRTAAASSTGGLFLKLPGRVGDTGVPGSGILANRYGAALCTGIGETFIRVQAASRVLNLLEQGITVGEAARRVMTEVEGVGGKGALLVADRDGHLAVVLNEPELPLAVVIDGEVIEDFAAIHL